MENIDKLVEIENVLSHSPIRQRTTNELPLNIDSSIFNEEIQAISSLIKNAHSPLKVAFVGEVKAGKSTLINAIAEKQVTPMNVLEATASIIEVKYSIQEKATIHFFDGSKIENENINNIYKILDDHMNDQEFFAKCKSVEIQLPLKNLKNLVLVDTPGLETISKENSDRTEQYLENADVIIWVLNAHYLGQSDVMDSMMGIIQLGKPVIAVLNRIDEIDGDLERLIDFLDEQIGLYVEEIMPISAFKAYKGVTEGNSTIKEESGYNRLIDYLEEKINSNVDSVKLKSSLQTAQNILYRDQIKHEKVIRTISFWESQIERSEKLVREYGIKAKNRILHKFDIWYAQIFLEKEIEMLKEQIQSSGLLNNKKVLKQVESEMEHLLSSDVIDKAIQEQIKELDHAFSNEWEKTLLKLKEEILIDLKKFTESEKEKMEIQLKYAPTDMEWDAGVLSGATAGAFVGGAAGGAAAFYAAVLGPAASYVTAGMAASAFVPPLLIIGGTVGLAAKVIIFRNSKKKAVKKTEDTIRSLKNEIHDTVRTYVEDLFSNHAEKISENIMRELTLNLANQNDLDDLYTFKDKIEDYLMITKEKMPDLVLN